MLLLIHLIVTGTPGTIFMAQSTPGSQVYPMVNVCEVAIYEYPVANPGTQVHQACCDNKYIFRKDPE